MRDHAIRPFATASLTTNRSTLLGHTATERVPGAADRRAACHAEAPRSPTTLAHRVHRLFGGGSYHASSCRYLCPGGRRSNHLTLHEKVDIPEEAPPEGSRPLQAHFTELPLSDLHTRTPPYTTYPRFSCTYSSTSFSIRVSRRMEDETWNAPRAPHGILRLWDVGGC
jgi:hypothetical protein